MKSGVSFGVQDYREEASLLVSALFDLQLSQVERLDHAKWRLHVENNRKGVSFPDIEWNDILDEVRRYRQQLDFSERHDLPMMCIELSEDPPLHIPVSIDFDILNNLLNQRKTPLWAFPNWISALEAWLKQRASIRGNMIGYSVIDALSLFKNGLINFITVRIEAWKKRGASHGSTYPFEVSTKTHGLRVYWTSAAACRVGNVFGWPTTPVSRKLPPGTYCFGAGRPGVAAHYEMTAYYDVPAQNRAYLDV